ncbi:MAG TPA: DUF3732 domain-containing protein, partial [Verrucomicrobiae bacterium]|nr:DUF3732 domain-containing protein [Verrucomicrobiae bacterium]
MKAFVRHIGVVDKEGNVNSVTFRSGLNIVTGKSSTGKSALIEIFDFCFGSSDFTVPDGIITNLTQIYFTVLRIDKIDLVLARKPNQSWSFIKAENDLDALNDPKVLTDSYFTDGYLRNLKDYNLEIGRWLGLEITDTQEDLQAREFTVRKNASPSIRSFASFMLQHQNLVANKHAVFYRFDEKEKREQAIEHFKIFLGFADQTYFIKAQELNSFKVKRKAVEAQIPKAQDLKAKALINLQQAMDEYGAISGSRLDIGKTAEIIKYPIQALEKLSELKIVLQPLSTEHLKLRQKHEDDRSLLTSKYRKEQQTLNAVVSSINFAKTYDQATSSVQFPESAELHASKCPFCSSEHSLVEQEANKLLGAINWLNDELGKSTYRLESFEEQERKSQLELEQIKKEIEGVDAKIAIIDKQTVDLAKLRSQYELALKAKLRVEAILEELISKPDQALEEQLKEINAKILELRKFLEDNYNVGEKLKSAEKTIQEIMGELGPRFEFEESYRPIKLHFGLDTFDLWHEAHSRKVFLRSMGSGANWLYSHLTLFLALQRYFAMLGNRCSIPSILFLDQPSQVYFPSVLDNAEEFLPKELAEKEGEARKRPVDEDIKAVTNLYSQLVRFCRET